jgi:DNA-directed RNA polymerase specialized sigma24 family protein
MEAVAGLPAFERPNKPRMIAGQSRKKDKDEIMAAEPGSDLDLLARVVSGETAALRSLYEAHGARLYAYALRVSGNPAVAEDIIQDSLLAIWKDAAKFRGEGRVIAWLLGIVHHKAMNAVRGRRSRRLIVVFPVRISSASITALFRIPTDLPLSAFF